MNLFKDILILVLQQAYQCSLKGDWAWANSANFGKIRQVLFEAEIWLNKQEKAYFLQIKKKKKNNQAVGPIFKSAEPILQDAAFIGKLLIASVERNFSKKKT